MTVLLCSKAKLGRSKLATANGFDAPRLGLQHRGSIRLRSEAGLIWLFSSSSILTTSGLSCSVCQGANALDLAPVLFEAGETLLSLCCVRTCVAGLMRGPCSLCPAGLRAALFPLQNPTP